MTAEASMNSIDDSKSVVDPEKRKEELSQLFGKMKESSKVYSELSDCVKMVLGCVFEAIIRENVHEDASRRNVINDINQRGVINRNSIGGLAKFADSTLDDAGRIAKNMLRNDTDVRVALGLEKAKQSPQEKSSNRMAPRSNR